MNYDSPENIEFFIQNSTSKSINEWVTYFGCGRSTIEGWKKKFDIKTKMPVRPPHTEESKNNISQKRREWLAQNPDKHPWRNSSKFKSKPCENVKKFLKKRSVNFVEEFSPKIQGRFFSIDIALPDKMIAIEINGNQHYEKTGELKPYYQSRHDLLEAGGWTVFQVHYSACFNLEKWGEFLNQIESLPSVKEFDYFNYRQKEKKKKYGMNMCECGQEKSVKSVKCRNCRYGTPVQNPTGDCPLEEGRDMRFTTGAKDKISFCECGRQKQFKSKKCIDCSYKKDIVRPTVEEMSELIWLMPTTQLAKQIGISDVAIAKFCKKNGIEKPPRGYWKKQTALIKDITLIT